MNKSNYDYLCDIIIDSLRFILNVGAFFILGIFITYIFIVILLQYSLHIALIILTGVILTVLWLIISKLIVKFNLIEIPFRYWWFIPFGYRIDAHLLVNNSYSNSNNTIGFYNQLEAILDQNCKGIYHVSRDVVYFQSRRDYLYFKLFSR